VESKVEERGRWERAITVTMDAGEVAPHVDKVVAQYRERMALPGFRRGKVPTDVVRARFQDSIENDVLKEILPEALDRVIQEQTFRLVGPPVVEELSFKPGEPLSFTAVVELWPEVEPKDYQAVELEEELTEIDDRMIDEFLDQLRERMADVNPVARPAQPGDFVEVHLLSVDMNGAKLPRAKREELRMIADGSNLLPEFREASVGISPGETRLVHLEYPADFGDAELAGRQRHYRFKAVRVLERNVPALDDALAQKVEGVPDLGALRAKVRLRFETEERMRGRERLEEVLIDRLLDRNPFDVPQSALERSLVRAVESARKENPQAEEGELREVLGPLVLRRWRRDILLDAIARKESIQLTDEEFEARLGSLLAGERDPAAARRRLERENRLEGIRERMIEKRTFEFLLSAATVHQTVKPRQRAEASSIIVP